MQRVKNTSLIVAALTMMLAAMATAQERRSDQSVPNASALAQSRPQAIQATDVIQVTISDLGGPGVDTARRVRVDAKGNISLPLVGIVKAEGLTPTELERAIVKSYGDANLIQNAPVLVIVGGIPPLPPPPQPPLTDGQRARLREIDKKAEKDVEAIQGEETEEMAKLSVERDDNDLPTFRRKLAELREKTQGQITAVRRQATRDADGIIAAGRSPATAPVKTPASERGA